VSEAALIRELEAILSGNPIAAIIASETKRGFRVLRPGDTPWFRAADWVHDSVASVSGTMVRFVLLHAFQSGKGAFTRTVKGAQDAGYNPSVIDPTREFAAMLKRRGWRGQMVGHDFETRETIWKPR
jgi:hypothetical protein